YASSSLRHRNIAAATVGAIRLYRGDDPGPSISRGSSLGTAHRPSVALRRLRAMALCPCGWRGRWASSADRRAADRPEPTPPALDTLAPAPADAAAASARR